jgi:hypothetical protein
VTITHATIARNRASSSNPFNGGGVRSEDEVEEGPVVNTILAENLPTNCDEWGLDSAGHDLADDASCGLGGPGDLENVDAQLGPLGNFGGPTRSIPPLPGSPAARPSRAARTPASPSTSAASRGRSSPSSTSAPSKGEACASPSGTRVAAPPGRTAAASTATAASTPIGGCGGAW